MMRTLKLSAQMHEQICSMWCGIQDDQDAWLEIEEEATALLSRHHAYKAKLLRLPILVTLLPKYMQPDQDLVDNAVITAALNTLGRPAFNRFNLLTELEDPVGPPSDVLQMDLLSELDAANSSHPAIRLASFESSQPLEVGQPAWSFDSEIGRDIDLDEPSAIWATRTSFGRPAFNLFNFVEGADLEPTTSSTSDILELDMLTDFGRDYTANPVHGRLRPLRKLRTTLAVAWQPADAV